MLRVVALRLRDDFGKNDDFLLDAGAAGEEHVHELFEVEEPERQFQVARIEHQGSIAEAAPVLVVAIEQEEPKIRPRLEDLLQDQRDAARLADAGRAEDREMLVQHVVDVDVGADRGVLLQVADVDRVGAGDIVDQAQLIARDQRGRIADRRIVGDAALEMGLAVIALPDLAHHVEARGRTKTLLARGCRDVLRHLRDHSDQQRLGALDAQELADGDRSFADRVDALQRQADARRRAADRKDAPARAPRIKNRTGGMPRVHLPPPGALQN